MLQPADGLRCFGDHCLHKFRVILEVPAAHDVQEVVVWGVFPAFGCRLDAAFAIMVFAVAVPEFRGDNGPARSLFLARRAAAVPRLLHL